MTLSLNYYYFLFILYYHCENLNQKYQIFNYCLKDDLFLYKYIKKNFYIYYLEILYYFMIVFIIHFERINVISKCFF